MKKFYYLVLLAVLALPFSCNKNNGANDGSDVKMTEPATKSEAAVVKFPVESAPEVLVKGNKAKVKEIEFTEASRFILKYEPETKAGEKETAFVGTYTVKDGVYTLSGIGSVKVSGNNVTVTPLSGAAQTVSATVTATKTSSDIMSNAARTWKVNTVIVGLSGGNVSIEKKFNGCNLEEISNYAKSNGVPISDEDMASLKGLSVSEIIVTGANTFVIRFANDVCYYGTCSISSSKSFSYKFAEGNDLLNVSASGTIDFPANSKCTLVLNTSATHNGTAYKGTMEFDLNEQK